MRLNVVLHTLVLGVLCHIAEGKTDSKTDRERDTKRTSQHATLKHKTSAKDAPQTASVIKASWSGNAPITKAEVVTITKTKTTSGTKKVVTTVTETVHATLTHPHGTVPVLTTLHLALNHSASDSGPSSVPITFRVFPKPSSAAGTGAHGAGVLTKSTHKPTKSHKTAESINPTHSTNSTGHGHGVGVGGGGTKSGHETNTAHQTTPSQKSSRKSPHKSSHKSAPKKTSQKSPQQSPQKSSQKSPQQSPQKSSPKPTQKPSPKPAQGITTHADSSASAAAASSLNALPQPSVITRTASGKAFPVLIGGAITAPITLSKGSATYQTNAPQVTSHVASISNQLVGVYPKLSAWVKKPDNAQAKSLSNDISPIIGAVGGLLASLPKGNGGGGCSGLSCSLGSIANGLGSVVGNLAKGDVQAVSGAVSGLESDTQKLNDNSKSNKQSNKHQTQKSTDQHSTKQSSQKSSCSKPTTKTVPKVVCPTTEAGGTHIASAITFNTGKAESGGSGAGSCKTTSTVTTGCDLTATVETTMTTAAACQPSALSAEQASKRAAGGSTKNGKWTPYAFMPLSGSVSTTVTGLYVGGTGSAITDASGTKSSSKPKAPSKGRLSTGAHPTKLGKGPKSTATSTPDSTTEPHTSKKTTTSKTPTTTKKTTKKTTTSTTPTTTKKTTKKTKTSTTSTSTSAKPLETCHTQYDVVLDTFSIYGFDWTESKLDGDGGYRSGDGLKSQLNGCGTITDWKFKNMTVTGSQPYQWHASGHTTIWQKSCIEHAMNSAGSPSESCSGSG